MIALPIRVKPGAASHGRLFCCRSAGGLRRASWLRDEGGLRAAGALRALGGAGVLGDGAASGGGGLDMKVIPEKNSAVAHGVTVGIGGVFALKRGRIIGECIANNRSTGSRRRRIPSMRSGRGNHSEISVSPRWLRCGSRGVAAERDDQYCPGYLIIEELSVILPERSVSPSFLGQPGKDCRATPGPPPANNKSGVMS